MPIKHPPPSADTPNDPAHDASDGGASSNNPAQKPAAASSRRGLPKHEFRQKFGGISNTTFHELVKRGDLSIHKIGRRTYVDVDEAERWWASCARKAR
jgi:hypothetical protein